MKQIERFLNRIYYTAYYMTAWIAFVPTRKQEEYERSVELTGVLHGLSYFYIIDCLLLLKLLGDYISGDIINSLFGNNFYVFFLCFFALTILVDFLIFHFFVYRGKKYLEYCREFEKESSGTKILWTLLVVLLYIIAIILMILIFYVGHAIFAKSV